jgi:TPR repeat protein
MGAKDLAEAARWFQKAAEQGSGNAQDELSHVQYALGECYRRGDGVTKDNAQADQWFRKAAANKYVCAIAQYRKEAEQGHAEGQAELGECYFYGRGVTEDAAEAVRWLRKAAERGDSEAQFCLGESYEQGRGVGKDPGEAAKWFRKAADQGHAYAKMRLKMLLDSQAKE